MSLIQKEFEAEKTASLHEKLQVLTQEREESLAVCQKEKETLSAQLQEKAERIIQVCGNFLKLNFGCRDYILTQCFHLSEDKCRENMHNSCDC